MKENWQTQEEKLSISRQPAFRVGVVLVIILVTFIIVRQLFVPGTFGQYGYYRGDNVDEWVVKAASYADENQCAACHTDRVKEIGEAQHGQFSCQTCHGAAGQHTLNPEVVKPVIEADREFCGRCHNKLAGRESADIKQVSLGWHYNSITCTKCHDAHEPLVNVRSW
ncbi:cytochrome c3 family protein [Metallumcola ferriviriculae]|uniref:Cytochrome c3 family protein n=1 Tax=Metallumcola ferriviriculae TaxID=3039180 RepID=A0AAU0US52_9FIRM|nr:cytochrome c3 family protein [Desulfitibacteraceae bacterium MK1]